MPAPHGACEPQAPPPPPPPAAPPSSRQIPAAPGHRSCSPASSIAPSAPAMEPGTVPREMPPLRCLRAVPARRDHREGQSPLHKLLPRRSQAAEGLLYSETLGALHCSIPGCSGCRRPASTSCTSRTPGTSAGSWAPRLPRGQRGPGHGAPRDLGFILTCGSNSVFSSIFALSFSPPPPPRLFGAVQSRMTILKPTHKGNSLKETFSRNYIIKQKLLLQVS